MPGEETINEAGQQTEGGASSTPQEHGDVKSTVEFTPATPAPAEAKKTDTEDGKGKEEELKADDGKETPPEKEEEGKEAKPKETPPEKGAKPKEKGEETRFDKHPRFQQILRERDEARTEKARLEGRLEALEKRIEQRGEEPTYKDILKMSDAEIRQALDPEEGNVKGFLANFGRQVEAEVMSGLEGKLFTKEDVESQINNALEETGRTSKIEQGYEKFAEKHPDFDDMWVNGELQDYVEAHPYHMPISAYYALTEGKSEETLQAKIDEAVEKAVKETEQRVRTEMQAKRGAQVIGSGPSSVRKSAEADARLKESKKFGGTNKVLADMLKEDRAAVGT